MAENYAQYLGCAYGIHTVLANEYEIINLS